MALPTPPKAARQPAVSRSAADALTPLIHSTYTSPTITFYLNGTRVELSDPDPHWTLLDFIRAQHGLKGTKLGCGEGGCGACTVVLSSPKVSPRTKKVEYLAVNACLFPLVGVDGKHLITVEGLGTVDNPHPLQERIAKLHGSQCGFCTPGIVMSLYALVRNAYNPETQEFHLSEDDIEREGHLDGNLCRCTGYKPILQAAKTFVTEDLKGRLAPQKPPAKKDELELDLTDASPSAGCGSPAKASCGRPGGCCRDKSPSTSSESDSEKSTSSSSALTEPDAAPPKAKVTDHPRQDSMVSGTQYAKPLKSREAAPEGTKVVTELSAPLAASEKGIPQYHFKSYQPDTELIFPPGLWRHEKKPLCFGNHRKIWFRPTTLQQLVELKNAYPSAKLVGGASEVQVEVRFKGSDFAVSVYVSDIEELQETTLPKSEAEWDAMTQLSLGANTPLTELEHVCKTVYAKLGQRALALEALRKQLRYFAGRQIRNVASLAGNVATASPISDANPVLMAVGADAIVRSQKQGAMALPLSKFFLAYRTTTLPPDAVITHLRIPLPPADAREVTKAYKQAKRKDDDIAIVTAAFRVRLDSEGAVTDICLAYGGMAPTTCEAKRTKEALMGKTWFESTTLEAGLDALADDFQLSFGVPGGMAHYRRALALSLFFRFWHEVVAELGIGTVDADLIQEIHRDLSSGTRDNYNPHEQRVVGKQVPHLSALKQCTGEAQYVDDIERQDRELFGALVMSSKAHAKLVEVDWTAALSMPGVVGYIDKDSIPKEANIWGSVKKDETFFADGVVLSHGHTIGMVYAETALQAQAAAKVVRIVYEELPAILTIDEAIEANSYFPHGKQLKKGAAIAGKMDEAFAQCDRVFSGVTKLGGQEHFYLETNAALAIPHKEDGSMEVWSSTQNTTETQEFVSQVLGVPSNRINARVKRMGGAFGGKESRSVPIACLCAVAARKEGRPVRMMLNRDEDMMTTGQRHPIQARWKVGSTADGKLVALDADVYDNAGYSQDMSGAVMDRCCTHIDNCYAIPHAHIRGHVCRTNIHSNTAFRGFGGPQAMYIAEQIMYHVADELGVDVDDLRTKNLYQAGDRTPFLQRIDEDWHVPTMLDQIKQSSNYAARKQAVAEFNATHKWKKRGIALLPSKFGLSFATALHLNQAGAYVKIYADGSVLLHHGGTEMGQGLYTKMCQVCAQELGVPLDAIFTQDSQSYQIANASPTAASSGSDLNGMAVKDACDQLNARLAPYWEKYGRDAPFKTVAHAAYLDRVNLAANGFWKMPRIGYTWGEYDETKVKDMYYYFTQGVAASEVELDLLTGDHTVLRSDILMDVGQSINPAIDYGQIEGAFVQGIGLFTIEESLWTRDGQLATRGPGTYKIPGFSDIPQVFNAAMLRVDAHGRQLTWRHLRSVQSSKGIGEPPLFLGASVFFALREAVMAARRGNRVEGKGQERLVLESPATAEKLRLAVGDGIVRRTRVVPREGETNFFVTVA
ncbi:Molybdopterin-binding domain of aldehyde dehydrogenase-domain-containing protein [Macrophomina phaseolina]|uniref:Molybdopterin-binding domain of aldehyde dehydrogenase-domain-containing protein n=1 Tax=Macrophomina phaseolina TaxID=35725 RepID=A0ABQ8GM20_9PEZI|nr:Molybdopterin-binding domain of aldehyde dehydrogenase-domain-containing protein [Macrophomina phaseolina]